jgi:hypothetical protein
MRYVFNFLLVLTIALIIPTTFVGCGSAGTSQSASDKGDGEDDTADDDEEGEEE